MDDMKNHRYFEESYEKELIDNLNKIQDVTQPFVSESVKTNPALTQPTKEFLQIEQLMNQLIQTFSPMVSSISHSIETMSLKKSNARTEEVQKQILAQLEVTGQNLKQVTNLFLGYHEARADIVYSIQKQGCIDYYLLLPVLEKKLCRALRGFVNDFKVHLLMLYDMLTLNYDKILREPKQASYSGYM